MTDNLMDARLREAGERWRASERTTIEDPDGTEELLDLGRRPASRPNRWLALVSAAVVAAALLVGGVLFANRQTHSGTRGVAASPAVPLRGTTWFDTMSGATATFATKTVRLSNGCISSTSPLTVAGSSMTIGRSITQSVCVGPAPPPTGIFHKQYLLKEAADNRFFNAFDGTVRWSIHGNYLTIRPSTGSTLKLATKHGLALSVFHHPWTLKYVIDDGENESVGTSTSLSGSLIFGRDGRLTGFAQCSTLNGSARVTDTSIVFNKVIETGHKCEPARASTPASLIRGVLSGETSFEVRLGELTITKKDLGTLIYVPQQATTQSTSDLAGVDWTLSSTETSTSSGNSASGSGSSAVGVGQSVLRFDGSGGFTISHRCYTDKGTAKISAGEVTLSGITLKSAVPCTQPVTGESEQNDFIDTLLKGTVTWSIDHQELTITKGGKSATFDRGPAGTASTLLRFTWHLRSIQQGNGPYGTGFTPKSSVPLTIDADSLHIGADCKSASASVRVESHGQLEIGALVSNASSCFGPGPDADQVAIARILQGPVNYRISGDQLTITKPGVGELVFTKS